MKKLRTLTITLLALFIFGFTASSPDFVMKVSKDENGQLVVTDNGMPVLQYNYQTVYEKDVIRNGKGQNESIVYFDKMSGIYFEEYLKCHPEFPQDTIVSSAIYAIPRGDYIHPLYGLKGEMLTNDWPDAGHPHHRGIFWAWPEVEYGTRRGDIYALQTVFARPTGNIEFSGGPIYAEIDAENLWMWEDKVPIVRERAIIKVYKAATEYRIIDLKIELQAIMDSVTIATRFTNSYGGLNVRMMTPESQDISYFTDIPNATPQRAWSDFSGVFKGNNDPSGLMVFQHPDNPEYPGYWQEYPDLSWVQPTFPTKNTRYALEPEKPLVLSYRFVIHSGGKPDANMVEKLWNEYQMNTVRP